MNDADGSGITTAAQQELRPATVGSSETVYGVAGSFCDSRSGASKTCVPKLELGNELNDADGSGITTAAQQELRPPEWGSEDESLSCRSGADDHFTGADDAVVQGVASFDVVQHGHWGMIG